METINILKINNISFIINIPELDKNIIINPPPKTEIKNQKIIEIIKKNENIIVSTNLKKEIEKTWNQTPIITNKQGSSNAIITVTENEEYWIDNENMVTILENQNILLKIGTITILYIYQNIKELEEPQYLDIIITTEKYKQKNEQISTKKIYPQIHIEPETLKENQTIKITRHLTQLHAKIQTIQTGVRASS
ncbi:MAG: hypothetical protein ACP6IP_07685 [Candidatus Njordarchaeia archaeon]